MRHRDDGTGPAKTLVTGTLTRITALLTEDDHSGRHAVVPQQKLPTHETVQPAATVTPTPAPAASVEPVEAPSSFLPETVVWKASHGPRMFAAVLLVLAVAGTSALGLRYAETRGPDDFLSVVIGVGIVVALWALLIASTPQVVSLRGSLLTVRNSSGSERFDLADGLQPVDVVGQPRSSSWALLLHRPDNTSVVLRRRDVDAYVLDPIVRHYRALADQRYADRQVRFSR